MADLSSRFTVIGMDQRNAGKSRGAVTETHGWHTYASDHLALMDHLGYRRFHVMGGCIGGTFCLTLCELAPERIAAAVLQNPIGLHENRDTWDEAVAGFAKTMLERDRTLTPAVIQKFGHNMFGGDFVFSVSREFVRRCPTPLLLPPGSGKPRRAARRHAARPRDRQKKSRIRPRPARRSRAWPRTWRSRRTGALRPTWPS